jgi:hypothetical protein
MVDAGIGACLLFYISPSFFFPLNDAALLRTFAIAQTWPRVRCYRRSSECPL